MDLRDLSVRMAAFARDLGEGESSEKAQQTIVDSAVELIRPCEVAGISVSTHRGEIRSAATTDEAAKRNDLIQQEEAQGPCMDAVWEELVVQVPDLREEGRWPRWASRTLEEGGVLSMLCVRLFTHKDRVGALNLFSSQPHAFGLDDEEEAVAIAAHAAVAVASAENIEGLKIAVGSRTVIGQATGMVMVQYGLTDGRAFDVLKRLSSHENRKLVAVARQLVEDWNTDPKQS